ncbi:hypothetical protein ABZ707_06860 [Streptomyces sp. NPDC006923]|uniref:hypothetical protein n=1 Tax=Streptomyces sp. NPDC006923 TaxID=3155355 RepID=UPI0033E9F28B
MPESNLLKESARSPSELPADTLAPLRTTAYVAFVITDPESWGCDGISRLARRRGATDHRR